MESAWIGLAGLLIGVLLGEYFHRNKRIEIYSQKVFDKRLSVHEELYKIFLESNEMVSEAMTNSTLNEVERKNLVGSVIHSLCAFTDKNGFYLNDCLIIQVVTAYMGAEDVLSYENELDAISVRSKVYESAKITKKMILEEAGVTEVFKHFSIISKSKPNSAVIRYFRRLRINKLTIQY